jgi:hypothetical protein
LSSMFSKCSLKVSQKIMTSPTCHSKDASVVAVVVVMLM